MGTTRLICRGFSLLEVQLSLIILTVAIVALLHAIGVAFRSYSSAHSQWQVTVDLWNRVEQSRAAPGPEEEWIQVLPQARPLYRVVLEDSSRRWEVLRAQK